MYVHKSPQFEVFKTSSVQLTHPFLILQKIKYKRNTCSLVSGLTHTIGIPIIMPLPYHLYYAIGIPVIGITIGYHWHTTLIQLALPLAYTWCDYWHTTGIPLPYTWYDYWHTTGIPLPYTWYYYWHTTGIPVILWMLAVPSMVLQRAASKAKTLFIRISFGTQKQPFCVVFGVFARELDQEH